MRAQARTARDPAYVSLLRRGELRVRAEEAHRRLARCDLCANACGANRLDATSAPRCRTHERARVHGAFPHHGEEDVLRGARGSGTIFFAACNLRCVFCQNAEIAWEDQGELASDEDLARTMLDLQRAGCHNVNLVSPSHVVAQVLAALSIAAERGLRLPLVWNTGGYDSLEALRLLDGAVDVYMPDMKYADAGVALRCSGVPRYPEVNRAAVREMHRQVGDLVVDESGVATRGLLVRHLVLPSGLSGTEEVMRFLAAEISPRTWVNVMGQYRPAHRASSFEDLARRPTRDELRRAADAAQRHGLERLDPSSGARAAVIW